MKGMEIDFKNVDHWKHLKYLDYGYRTFALDELAELHNSRYDLFFFENLWIHLNQEISNAVYCKILADTIKLIPGLGKAKIRIEIQWDYAPDSFGDYITFMIVTIYDGDKPPIKIKTHGRESFPYAVLEYIETKEFLMSVNQLLEYYKGLEKSKLILKEGSGFNWLRGDYTYLEIIIENDNFPKPLIIRGFNASKLRKRIIKKLRIKEEKEYE